MIVVDIKGNGDMTSISEAVKRASGKKETIFVKKGVYRERVEITEPNIEIIGEDAENTVITYGLYANMKMESGEKRGTFRSYTMLVNTDNFTCRSITVSNSAGFGKDVGQAVAVYAEGDMIRFENCRILGHQDTLFTGPLPFKELEKGGFRGPTEFAERKQGRQFYKDCFIEGDVDFIFGSAAAFFDNCELHSLDRGEETNGYVTAASTYEGSEFGYVFTNCRFTGECAPASVYLGRPWRDHAKTVL
ncbi:MAG: pectinesterase family protein, partial [Huintestinicola sp.]